MEKSQPWNNLIVPEDYREEGMEEIYQILYFLQRDQLIEGTSFLSEEVYWTIFRKDDWGHFFVEFNRGLENMEKTPEVVEALKRLKELLEERYGNEPSDLLSTIKSMEI